jgi:hypothetical protein
MPEAIHGGLDWASVHMLFFVSVLKENLYMNTHSTHFGPGDETGPTSTLNHLECVK